MAFHFRRKLSQTLVKPFPTIGFSRIRNAFRNLNNFELPDRWKGTFIEKWGLFWKQLGLDYKDVIVNVYNEFKTRPVKSCTYVSILCTSYYAAKHNPDAISFRDNLLNKCSDMNLVGVPIRNPKSLSHIQMLNECYAEGLIRYLSLGIVSFIWLDNYDEKLTLYKATCPYLKPQYKTFYKRIIDVGFLDTWWILERKMVNFDINEEEFQIPTKQLANV